MSIGTPNSGTRPNARAVLEASGMGGGRTLWRWTDADIAKGRKVKAAQKPGPKASGRKHKR